MTTFNQGDIILIPFPFTDLSTIKQRPAIIISSTTFNNSQSDIIAIAVSSHIPEVVSATEYLLSWEETEMARLPKTSVIKVNKIITINKIMIRKKLGHLSASTVNKIKDILQTIL